MAPSLTDLRGSPCLFLAPGSILADVYSPEPNEARRLNTLNALKASVPNLVASAGGSTVAAGSVLGSRARLAGGDDTLMFILLRSLWSAFDVRAHPRFPTHPPRSPLLLTALIVVMSFGSCMMLALPFPHANVMCPVLFARDPDKRNAAAMAELRSFRQTHNGTAGAGSHSRISYGGYSTLSGPPVASLLSGMVLELAPNPTFASSGSSSRQADVSRTSRARGRGRYDVDSMHWDAGAASYGVPGNYSHLAPPYDAHHGQPSGRPVPRGRSSSLQQPPPYPYANRPPALATSGLVLDTVDDCALDSTYAALMQTDEPPQSPLYEPMPMRSRAQYYHHR